MGWSPSFNFVVMLWGPFSICRYKVGAPTCPPLIHRYSQGDPVAGNFSYNASNVQPPWCGHLAQVLFTAAGFTAAPPQGNANKHLDFSACEKGCQTLPDREVYLRLVSTVWFLYQAGTGFDQKPVTRFKVYVASCLMPCACLIVFVWNGFLGNVFVWDSRAVISECYVDLYMQLLPLTKADVMLEGTMV